MISYIVCHIYVTSFPSLYLLFLFCEAASAKSAMESVRASFEDISCTLNWYWRSMLFDDDEPDA